MRHTFVLFAAAVALGCGSGPNSGPATDPGEEVPVEPAGSGALGGGSGAEDTTPPALLGQHSLYSEQTFFVWFTEAIPRDGVVALRAWVDGEPISVSVDEEARASPGETASDSRVAIRFDGPTDGGLSGRILPLEVELDMKDRAGNAATVRFEAQWITDAPALRLGANHMALTADGAPTVAEYDRYDAFFGISRWTSAGWSGVANRSGLESGCLALAVDPAGPAYVGGIDWTLRATFLSFDAPAVPPIPPAAEVRSGPYCVDAVVDAGGRLVAVVEESALGSTTYLRLLGYEEGTWRELTEVAVPGDCTTVPALHVDARRTPVLSYFERDCSSGPFFWEGRPAPALVALRLLALEGDSLTPAAEPLSSRTLGKVALVKVAEDAPSPVVLTADGVLRWAGARWENLGAPGDSAQPWPGIDSYRLQVAITPEGEIVVALPTSDGADLWRWRAVGWERVPGFKGIPDAQIADLEIDPEGRPVLLFNVAGAAFVRRGEPLP
jgi:hypothetical protein